MSPSVVVWRGGFDVYARAADGSLRRRFYAFGDGWGPWYNLGGEMSTAPAAVSAHPDRIDIFAVDGESTLSSRTWMGQWLPWASMGAPAGVALDAQPGATRWHNITRIELFASGQDGAAWHRSHWSPP
jgi:hypothetical protein